MSDTPSHERIPKGSNRPDQEVFDFREENCDPPENSEPLPDPNADFSPPETDAGPMPDPFEDFSPPPFKSPDARVFGDTPAPRRASIGVDDLPSLDSLFKPFDLSVPAPDAVDEDYKDFYSPKAEAYVYEDLDTRDPEVVRTLRQATDEAERIIGRAKAQAAEIMARAETEAKGLAAETLAAEREELDKKLQAAEEKNSVADQRFQAAEETLRSAENELAEAGQAKAEAEQSLAEAAERLAGLDNHKEKLEAEHAAKVAEFEAAKESVMAEAREEAKAEGLTAGLEAGRESGHKAAVAEFQGQVENFLALAAKLENIYNDLWEANGPMMIKLAIESVERILNKELPRAEGLAAAAFAACVDYLTRAHKVTVLVRPEDLELMDLARAEQRVRLGALVKVEFKGDAALGPGDLIIDSDIGRLDATVKRRAAQVTEVLREAFDRQYGSQTTADENIIAARGLSSSFPAETFKSPPNCDGALPLRGDVPVESEEIIDLPPEAVAAEAPAEIAAETPEDNAPQGDAEVQADG